MQRQLMDVTLSKNLQYKNFKFKYVKIPLIVAARPWATTFTNKPSPSSHLEPSKFSFQLTSRYEGKPNHHKLSKGSCLETEAGQ